MLGLILWHVCVGTAAAWDIQLAVDYYTMRDIRHLCFLSCSSLHRQVTLTHSFLNNNIRVSTKRINEDLLDLERYLYQRTVPLGVLLDANCEQTNGVLEKASKNRLFDKMHIWLIIDANSYLEIRKNETVTNIMRQMNLSVDADITLATKIGDRYELLEIFNFGKIQGNHLESKPIGTWSVQTGLNISFSTYKYYDRWDFHNLSLRVVTVVLGRQNKFAPEVLTSLTDIKGISVFTKAAALILEPLKNIHNFRFNYTVAGRWIGQPERNASLAVTNSLYWCEQDLSCTSARINSMWLKWVDVLHPPVTKLETKFFFLMPNKGIGSYENQFLAPLSPEVWWCAVGVGTLCILVLATGADIENRPRPWLYAILSVFGAVSQAYYDEGLIKINKGISSQGRRLAFLVPSVMCMLLYNYYTSSVVSWLLSAAPSSISDIDHLIHSDFELIFEDIGYTRGWFEDAGFFYYGGYRNPKEDELRRKKVTNAKRTKNLYQSVERGIELIRTGDFAYHTEAHTAYQSISRTFDDTELCRLGSLSMIHASPVYIMTQKRSPYKEFFDWSLLRLNERGHMTAARARLASVTATCSGSTPRALALGQAAPAFALLLAAIVVTLLILCIEIYCHRWEQKKHKRTTRQSPVEYRKKFFEDYKKNNKGMRFNGLRSREQYWRESLR